MGVVFVCVSTAASFASVVVVVLLGALFAPRFVLEACCTIVVVFPGVFRPPKEAGAASMMPRAPSGVGQLCP